VPSRFSRLHDAECGPSAVPRQGEAGAGQQALEHRNGRCGVALLALGRRLTTNDVGRGIHRARVLGPKIALVEVAELGTVAGSRPMAERWPSDCVPCATT
jgi:hypothetical protein